VSDAAELRPTRDDIEPVTNEATHRFITALVTALPILGLAFVAWQLWEKALHWSDQLRHHTMAAVHVRRTRLGSDRGPGDLLGGRPPQAPRVLR
jgi:hypothetical protein